MPHAQLPEEDFQRILPRTDLIGTALPYDSSKHNKPCFHGSSCKFFAMGLCYYYHEPRSLPDRLTGIERDLSDQVRLPAFGAVDTTFQWYGIRNAETLASFNVFRDGRLAVPGLPPVLRRPDSDLIFQTSDGALPSTTSRELPIFDRLLRALHILQPDLDPSSLSVITTAGCLRRIAAFLSHRPMTERLDIEFRHGTLFVGRWESDELYRLHVGYGKQFEKAVRRYSPGLEATVSSHIVARYEMGGLRMGVQVEVDAFECKCHSHSKVLSNREAPRANKRHSGGRFDALADIVDDDDDDAGEAEDGILRVGTLLPLSCAVEIKTRRRKAAAEYSYIPQLYFQQIPRVFVATRDNAKFPKHSMEIRDERKELRRWEAENQVLLGRLVTLLKRLRSEAERRAKSDGLCKMALVLKGGPGGTAVLYTREGDDLISDD